jgi:hypothetical protein
MVEEVNSSIIHSTYSKHFCKCHNVPPPNTTFKKELRKKKHIMEWCAPSWKVERIHTDKANYILLPSMPCDQPGDKCE